MSVKLLPIPRVITPGMTEGRFELLNAITWTKPRGVAIRQVKTCPTNWRGGPASSSGAVTASTVKLDGQEGPPPVEIDTDFGPSVEKRGSVKWTWMSLSTVNSVGPSVTPPTSIDVTVEYCEGETQLGAPGTHAIVAAPAGARTVTSVIGTERTGTGAGARIEPMHWAHGAPFPPLVKWTGKPFERVAPSVVDPTFTKMSPSTTLQGGTTVIWVPPDDEARFVTFTIAAPVAPVPAACTPPGLNQTSFPVAPKLSPWMTIGNCAAIAPAGWTPRIFGFDGDRKP